MVGSQGGLRSHGSLQMMMVQPVWAKRWRQVQASMDYWGSLCIVLCGDEAYLLKGVFGREDNRRPSLDLPQLLLMASPAHNIAYTGVK